jgi:hypothetical protein
MSDTAHVAVLPSTRALHFPNAKHAASVPVALLSDNLATGVSCSRGSRIKLAISASSQRACAGTAMNAWQTDARGRCVRHRGPSARARRSRLAANRSLAAILTRRGGAGFMISSLAMSPSGAELLSEAQFSLIRRAAAIECELEWLDARMSRNEPVDMDALPESKRPRPLKTRARK